MAKSGMGSASAWNSCPSLEPSLPLKTAPRRDQRIRCALFIRRLTSKLAIAPVNEEATRRPARWQAGAIPDGTLSGMVGVTLLGLFLTPVFYVTIRSILQRFRQRKSSADRASARLVESSAE
jgi:hypothetical protein